MRTLLSNTGHSVRKTVWMRTMHSKGWVSNAACGPLPRSTDNTHELNRQVGSHGTVTFNARRIATQTSTDSYVCAPSIAPKPGDVLRLLSDLLDRSTVGHEIESELGGRQLHQQRVPPNTSQNFAPIWLPHWSPRDVSGAKPFMKKWSLGKGIKYRQVCWDQKSTDWEIECTSSSAHRSRHKKVSGDTQGQSEKKVSRAGRYADSFAGVANPPTVWCTALEEQPLHEFASTSGHSKRCWAQYTRPLQRAQHLSSLWTPGKISATPLKQTSRSASWRASQVSTSSACRFPRSADSTHDPNRTGSRKSWCRQFLDGGQRSRGPELQRKIRDHLVNLFPPSTFFWEGHLTCCMAVSVLNCLCNNAIPSASERSQTTTIALCKAATDWLKFWKLTPKPDFSSARWFTAASSCSWSLVNFAPKSVSLT